MASSQKRSNGRPVEIKSVDIGGRTPKHSLENEQAVLAAMTMSPRNVDLCVSAGLKPEAFFVPAHQRLCEAIYALHQQGHPADLPLIAAWLKERDLLQQVGGVAFLARIIDATPAIAHVEAYATLLMDLALVRQVGETCQLAAAESYLEMGPVRDWVSSVESRIYGLASARFTSPIESVWDVGIRVLESFNRPPRSTPSTFVDLDEKTGGWHDGELIIVAGRPGMGKTSFAMDCARRVAALEPSIHTDGYIDRPKLGVAVFTLEMPKEQLTLRLACAEARVDVGDAVKAKFTDIGWTKFVGGMNAVSQLPIFLDETSAIGIPELRSKIRETQRRYDRKNERGEVTQRIGLVVIDYLQLMSGEGDSREEEVAFVSRRLKQLAKELHVPIIAIAQLNRDVETRSAKSKRPQLSDLRESGSLEQDADVVIFLYRPEYYLADKNTQEAQKLRGYAEVIVAKQRNGPTGIVQLTFTDYAVTFDNRARDAWRPDEAA
jgi:replicative DNA helicase